MARRVVAKRRRERYVALVLAEDFWTRSVSLTPESGAKATAVQTLRAVRKRQVVAERLDCGAFTAAFRTGGKFSDEDKPTRGQKQCRGSALPPQSMTPQPRTAARISTVSACSNFVGADVRRLISILDLQLPIADFNLSLVTSSPRLLQNQVSAARR